MKISSIVASLLTSVHGWSGLLAGILWILNNSIPFLPTVWANIVIAVLALFSFYGLGKVTAAGRAQGIKGV